MFSRLNPGLYFMNAGVFGEKDGVETFLHRIVDAVAFRVVPELDNLETEALFLRIKPEITIIH
jgi:lipopolysaccharide transport system ATP-binding protein